MSEYSNDAESSNVDEVIEDQITQFIDARQQAASEFNDPALEAKMNQYGSQVKGLRRINTIYNVFAPIIITYALWSARREVFREDCKQPAYNWSLYAIIYYALASLLKIREIVLKLAESYKFNKPWMRFGETGVTLVSCLMWPISLVLSFVLILSLLWSDDCPALHGSLLTWFIVQLCSWLSLCLCCGISGYSGFDLIRQEAEKAKQSQEEPAGDKTE